jgi:uncharacterized C2H2 Zn-finger protein
MEETFMSESIVKELLAENVGLRDENKKLREQSDLNYMFQIISLGKPIKISGVLIAEGIWKGLKYSFDEMKKALSKFVGLPVLVDHGRTKEFGSNEIGKITNVKADDILRSLVFEADITDDKAIELTTSKTLDAISIKGKFNEINTTSAPPEGKDYEPIEASLTSSPACEFCHIFNIELSNYLNKQDKSLNISKPNIIQGGLNMSNLEEEFFVSEDEILVAPELTEDTEFEFEIMKEGAFTDELAKKKTAYKVYPGYYPKKAKRGLKKAGKYYPKYPYYKYEKYAKKKKLSELEMLDILDLAKTYRAWMKECMGKGEDMASCAAKWKPEYGASQEPTNVQPLEDEFEMEQSLAEFKCPACDWTGKSLDEFKAHWNKEHKDQYGKYKHARKLMKAILTKKELRDHVKKVLELSEVDTSGTPATPEPTITEEDIIKKYAGKPKEIAELLLKSEGH